MKRLLLSALVAAAIHAFLLLGMDFGRFGIKASFRSEPRIVILNLVSRSAAKVEPAPMVPAPEPKPKIKPAPPPPAKTAAEEPPESKRQKAARPEAKPGPALKRNPPLKKKASIPPPEPLPVPGRQVPPAATPEETIAGPPIPPTSPQTEMKNPAEGKLLENALPQASSDSKALPPRTDGFADKPRAPASPQTPAAPPQAGIDSENGIEAALQNETAVIEARPRYSINPKPGYPLIARKKGYQGTVVLDVLVDREGRVVDRKVFRSSGHASLDRAALEAVGNWAFEPGRKGAETVEMWVQIPIRFELK